MSTHEITCPTCRASFDCPAERMGKLVRCGACSTVFTAPMRVAQILPPVVPAKKLNIAKPEVKPASVVSKPKRVEEDDNEPTTRPKRKVQQQAPSKLPLILGACAGGLFMFVILAFVVYAVTKKSNPETATATTEVKTEPVAAPQPTSPSVAAVPKTTTPTKPPELNPADAIKSVKNSTVYIRVTSGQTLGMGSGFFAGEPGYIVTNSHVIGFGPDILRIPSKVEVVVHSGESDQLVYNARIVGLDVEEDLALLWINEKDQRTPLPKPLPFGQTNDLVETQEVLIFGFPLGEQLGLNISVNKSTISSLRKSKGTVEVVQVAGGMTNGNSGGPVTNTKGDVIGVSVAVIKGTQINFAIPSDKTAEFVRRQIASGGTFQLGRFAGQWQPTRR